MSSKAEPIDARKRYFNPILRDSDGATEGVKGGPLKDPTDENPANLVSSLCDDGKHRPALDIDVPCQLIPSSTQDHYHLYFPTIALSWERYLLLLKALVDAGIIEQRYLDHSIERGQTLLRPPGVTKEKKP